MAIQVLGIPGSLRRDSHNRELLRAASCHSECSSPNTIV